MFVISTQRYIDMNIHTDNSHFGKASPMCLCEAAIRKGLRAVTFTDHCDLERYFDENYENSTMYSYFECMKARVSFRGELLILIGLEFCNPLFNKEIAESVIKRNKLDYVLAGLHELSEYKDEEGNINFFDIDIYKYMTEYFEKLIPMASWDGCDALAHLTYPMRGIEGECGFDFDYSKIQEVIDTLLDTMVKNGKALEINTSGYRLSIGKPTPDENIIKRFKELGGKDITIGSDSHRVVTVGDGIHNGLILAKKCGFDKVTFFEKREKLHIDIRL